MNKADLIENIAKATKVTKVDAELVLNSMLDTWQERKWGSIRKDQAPRL